MLLGVKRRRFHPVNSRPPSRGACSDQARPRISNSLLTRILFFAALLFWISARIASAYALEGPSWPGPTVPVRVQMGPSNLILKDGSTSWNAVAENAFAIWNEQIARVQVNWSEAAPGTPAQEGDQFTTIQFGSTIYGESFDSSTLAITLVDSSGAQMSECDVIFNTKFRFDSYRGPMQFDSQGALYDLHRIALHEFGHVLGLDHPDQAKPPQKVNAIMNSHIGDIDGLQVDDITGIQALYGKPPLAPPAQGNGHLANISTRVQVGINDNVMIGGFILQGTRSKKVIIRALGPSTHLPGALANPTLELHDKTHVVMSNDDWRTSQEQEIIATGIPPASDLESAIVTTLPANNSSYTAIVRGIGNTTGVALVEIYDLDSSDPANSKLGNISTRGLVGTGDNVLIGGFIITDAQTKTVVVRALGPSTGVAGAVANPTLELRNGNGDLLASNDNSPYDTYVVSYQLAPVNQLEAAVGKVLAPGNYTVIVRGVNSITGIGLVEVYGVQ